MITGESPVARVSLDGSDLPVMLDTLQFKRLTPPVSWITHMIVEIFSTPIHYP